jgi:serine/threonine protein phosphatase PrpC
MLVSSAGVTQAGQSKQANEDAILVDNALELFAVCDGMGGAEGGAEASYTCVETLRRVVTEALSALARAQDEGIEDSRRVLASVLEDAVKQASAEVFAASRLDSSKRGMGTTVAAVLARGNFAVVAHAGNSRAYLLRGGNVSQLTVDHTVATDMLRKGKLTDAQVSTSEYDRVLTRSVGTQAYLDVDALFLELMPRDRILLVTDGVHRHVPAAELAAVIGATQTTDAPAALVKLAAQRDGRDDLAAVIVELTPVPEPEEHKSPSRQLDVLRSAPLFGYLTEQERMTVISHANARDYAAGEVIMQEGEVSPEVYVLLHGQVAVMSGGERVSTLESGAHFGEMSLLDGQARSATIVTEQPCCLLVLTRDGLHQLMRENDALAVKLLWSFCQVLGQRLRTTNIDLSGAYRQVRASGSGAFQPFPTL